MKDKEAFISVDIEASGKIPGEYNMVALGACEIDNPQRTFYAEIKPTSSRFDRNAMRIASLGLECLKELKHNPIYNPSNNAFQPRKVLEVLGGHGEDPEKAMYRFKEWVERISNGRQPVFVAFNATFDWSFVNWYLVKYANDNPFGISGLDMKAYYMGKYHVKHWSETKKSKFSPELLSGKEHVHHALEDAIEQAEIFRRLRDAKPRIK